MQQHIHHLIDTSIKALQKSGKIPTDLTLAINVETTRNPEHGDFASNIALLLAKNLKCAPLAIAEDIINKLPTSELIAKTETKAPGFINFYLADKALYSNLSDILHSRECYGHTEINKNKYAIVEFVSANPTGPLHVGHGRGAAFGDTIANLLETTGFKVHREYYVNDAGRQMHVLALSIWLRYLELDGKELHFPASGYKGEYIIEIAQQLKGEYRGTFERSLTDLYQDLPADEDNGGDKEFYVDAMINRAQDLLGVKDYDTIFKIGINTILADIREDLEEFGVTIQEWFSENHLIANNDIAKGIDKLRDSDCVFEKDGALWFNATKFGDEKDRVLVRSNGQTTYFASDVGYHLNKYSRGFDLIIDVFGADHHGYAPRINAFLQAMNLDRTKLKILLVQFAILYRGKQKVSMSTRGGEFVTLRKLREEVGNDAARFFYIMRKNDQHLDFDLELAKSQSADNPVYYIQYAHARIRSVFNQLVEKGWSFSLSIGLKNLELLKTQHEINLLKLLLHYPSLLQNAALNYEPHILANYLRELANGFHTYYNAHQFLVEDKSLRNVRLCLIDATRQILANGLGLLGVSAPDAM